ncbi:MAG: hypothetical protein JW820_01560 [Spirochaetales bacterium]|nr:hypothetical protein [Spirochaetales bacterium]
MKRSAKPCNFLILAALGASLLLASCIGIESGLVLRADGSGTLILSYKISQYMKNIDVGRDDERLPLPVSQEDFLRTVEGIEGLRLADLDQREDEENVYIRAILEFTRLEALNALSPDPGLGLSLTTAGGETVFRQTIAPAGNPEELSEDSRALVEEFFSGYELAYRLTAPSAVLRHNLGELSEDGRSVSYNVTVPQLLQTPEPVILEVAW